MANKKDYFALSTSTDSNETDELPLLPHEKPKQENPERMTIPEANKDFSKTSAQNNDTRKTLWQRIGSVFKSPHPTENNTNTIKANDISIYLTFSFNIFEEI
jgi:hypothetical protein